MGETQSMYILIALYGDSFWAINSCARLVQAVGKVRGEKRKVIQPELQVDVNDLAFTRREKSSLASNVTGQ